MNSCPHLERNDITNSTTDFDFGIFLDVLRSGVAERRDFPQKFLYCFWWGLKNLSSLGQGLNTSTYGWEILFAVFIGILGLVLFSSLIGNMQKYLQSITSISVRVEEMRVKRRDAEQWMANRLLPETLRERIRRYDHYRWQETRGVDEESLLHSLPKDLRRDIKRHLCWDLLTRVPMFSIMDRELLDAMCDRLKPVRYTENTIIFREEDPVDEMLFVTRGNIHTSISTIGETGSNYGFRLKPGDYCGEELLTWALDPKSSNSLPSSTRTVKAITDVEAFGLMADDFKFIASKFRKLHSREVQHTFRFYSQQWRTWGACFIQASWRRYCKIKHDKMLHAAEDRLQDALLTNIATNSVSLGAALYASRFTANALRALRNNQSRSSSPKFPSKLPPLLLQKPTEPDFTAQNL
jgi:cyclic nucleotide gated channel